MALYAFDGTWNQDEPTPISVNKDFITNPRRKTYPTDRYHPTTMATTLGPGETATFTVHSRDLFSWSGVRMATGGQYTFDFIDGQTWRDGDITCGPDGWKTEDQDMNIAIKAIIKIAEQWRRHKEANWFEVIGAIGESDDHLFRIGDGSKQTTPFTAPAEGDLYCFANDLESKYENNQGIMQVKVSRVA